MKSELVASVQLEHKIMSKQTKQLLKNIQSIGINELELLKQKVYGSMLEVSEKKELLSAIEERIKSIGKDDVMVEFSEIDLD